jgi:hypothetical protein
MADDFRLVAGRQLVWENNPTRDPGYRGLVIRTLEDIASNEVELWKSREEADRIVETLYAQGKAAAARK